MTTTDTNLAQIAQNAKLASYTLASMDEETKNKALLKIADAIEHNQHKIYDENQKDLDAAQEMVDNKEITQSTFNRLKLDENKMRDMIQGIRDVAKLEDPVNKKLWAMKLDDGLDLFRVSCPIGVIGVVFEARPDVIPQIASLAIKSANAVLLKGGKEATNTNLILTKLINDTLDSLEEFPKGTINLLLTRDDVNEMLSMEKYIDLIIPRGGNALVQFIQHNTKIPVLGHADGICHIYVDDMVNYDKAVPICVDSKVQYPSACNSVETILLNENILNIFLPRLVEAMRANGVTVKGDEKCKAVCPEIEDTIAEDWATEYGDKIVSIKAVKDLFEAIAHINIYGSGHTDSILCSHPEKIELFMNLVDSAGVFANTSTRFADGFRYGLGAEVGISTNKTHARGPVGLEGLTIYKYKLYGDGQLVSEYCEGKRHFKHERLI